MKKQLLFIFLFIFSVVCSLITLKGIHAFFSDNAASNNNIFAAAQVFPTATPSATPTFTPTPTPQIATTLVFNEFVYNTTCGNNAGQNAGNYWIELFNGSSQSVDLKDWRFRDGDGSTIQISNSNKTVLSGQYVIITKDGSVFSGGNPCFTKQGTPVEANLGGNDDFLPGSTGGVIILEQPNGSGGFIVVDRVEYGPTLNSGALNAPAMQSVARTPNGIDTAAGNAFNVTDFTVDSTPSPGTSN